MNTKSIANITEAHKILLADLLVWARENAIATGTIWATRKDIWVEWTFA